MFIEGYRHYSWSNSYLRDQTSLFTHPYAEPLGFFLKKCRASNFHKVTIPIGVFLN